MKYRMIGTDPATRREVSVLSLGAMRTLVAYSPLLVGAYSRGDRLGAQYDHPGTPARLRWRSWTRAWARSTSN